MTPTIESMMGAVVGQHRPVRELETSPLEGGLAPFFFQQRPEGGRP